MEQYTDHLDAPTILAALLDEFSTATDYRTLRDTLPQRLAALLQCRCVLLYQHMGETLQFAAGSFAEQPGWSAALLTVAHINPIELQSELPEAQAWRMQQAIVADQDHIENALICTPLIYRKRAIGVLTVARGYTTGDAILYTNIHKKCWLLAEISLVAVVANVVAMLLENTRLLERDRERIHELFLLNSITSQMNGSLRERARVQRIVLQRAKEISRADLCEVLMPDLATDKAAWLPSELHALLLQHWQSEMQATPLVLERTSEIQADDYLGYLSAQIKTFFALPLIGKRDHHHTYVDGGSLAWHALHKDKEQDAQVFGVIVGAYNKPWKLRREELVLLQILANQASSVLENIALMEDVVEARNEARRLLHQVLDDQRIKELILESIPSGLITIDIHGHITTFNRAAETVLGYHPMEVIGQPARKILALHSLENVLQTGQPQHETLLTSGRQGQEVALDVTLAPLRDDQGRQMGVLATFADVTSMHQLAEETRRLDRLASLGKMSASVAHEVRNPLASIKISMQMLLDDLESNTTSQADEGTREAVSVVLKEVERLDGIVRDLLLFARPRHLHLVECNLLELSTHLLHFLQPQYAEQNIRVHLVEHAIPLVHVDVAQMEQVLMNLFLNAFQAMPNGGILSVSCQVVQIPVSASEATQYADKHPSSTFLLESALLTLTEEEEPPTTRSQQKKHQTWLEMSVSDTGTGIAQDDLVHIFQPFYTTKAHGIGLGLPITRRLIEDHRGSLLVESQLGYGTTVSVRLPLNEA